MFKYLLLLGRAMFLERCSSNTVSWPPLSPREGWQVRASQGVSP